MVLVDQIGTGDGDTRQIRPLNSHGAHDGVLRNRDRSGIDIAALRGIRGVSGVIDGTLTAQNESFRLLPLKETVGSFCNRCGRNTSAGTPGVQLILAGFGKVEKTVFAGETAIAAGIGNVVQRDKVHDTVQIGQKQRFLFRIQGKAGIWPATGILFGTEKRRDSSCGQNHLRQTVLQQIIKVVGEIIVREIDRIRRDVDQFDPVAVRIRLFIVVAVL